MHGWDGSPEHGWFPWLRRELESRGFEVHAPLLPDTGSPRIHAWVPKLAEVVGAADDNTYFIGHSMGCQAIARYLETLPEDTKVGGAIFVAGFFKRLTGLEDEAGVEETVAHWLTAPLNLARVKARVPRSIAIFSDNDPYVPLDNQDDFRDALGSEIIIEHGKGHFSGSSDGAVELPVVLESLLKIAQ